ncbi:MAG: RimK family protein [Legionellaceae bacterium]|nr:RimK family protein [Legionellaceae bacterium]
MQTLIVTDDPLSWDFLAKIAPIVHASDYLSNESSYHNLSMRVMNLCQSYDYQSIGYYVSLLAQARDHKAIPSALSIQDALTASLSKQISHDIDEEIQHSLKTIKADAFVFSLYFGQNLAKKHAVLAKKLHGLFPLPLLRFSFEKKKKWSIKKIALLSLKEVPEAHVDFMQHAAETYLSKKRFHQWSKKQRFHDVAMLVDPSELNAPSNKKALEAFLSAGDALGINVEMVDKNDIKSIAEYDGLFIRATTAVEHYTYRFARRAAQENMVVIDDPQSIVKCTNKVYLAELLRSHDIPTPQTLFVSKFDNQLPPLEFPCVLKKPDSAFSHGVIKLQDKKSLEKAVAKFFKTSDLILIQAYIPTDFDWRIGILDHKPLFACRYYMASGHWQIYNWDATHNREGDVETVSLHEVPEAVIKLALKATRLIGNSLYGVDIKSRGDQHYVIEVNDNPSIDFGIEDKILGEQLYHDIMRTFLQRIRRKHGYV